MHGGGGIQAERWGDENDDDVDEVVSRTTLKRVALPTAAIPEPPPPPPRL
jgi:hypothetical protein